MHAALAKLLSFCSYYFSNVGLLTVYTFSILNDLSVRSIYCAFIKVCNNKKRLQQDSVINNGAIR